MIKKYLKNFWSAVLAGVAISLGCIVFLSVENKIIGSLLFAVGLLTILAFKLNLFTGKAPYICENKPSYCIFAGVVWLGNFVGAFLTSLLVRYTRIYNSIIDKCLTVANTKVSDNLVSLFILGLYCGMLMYIAVDTFSKQSGEKNFSATVQTILCVSVFMLSNFEHSIADMFYFMLALPITQWALPLIVITFGNIIGGNLFCFTNKIIKEVP
jgi:formate/nitrite transporter FocA (FNT family)